MNSGGRKFNSAIRKRGIRKFNFAIRKRGIKWRLWSDTLYHAFQTEKLRSQDKSLRAGFPTKEILPFFHLLAQRHRSFRTDLLWTNLLAFRAIFLGTVALHSTRQNKRDARINQINTVMNTKSVWTRICVRLTLDESKGSQFRPWFSNPARDLPKDSTDNLLSAPRLVKVKIEFLISKKFQWPN